MDFSLLKEHLLSQALYRSFAKDEVKLLMQDIDEKEDFPWEIAGKMVRCGMIGIPVPEEYGGQGCDTLSYITRVEELAKVCGVTSAVLPAHTSLCIDLVLTYGTKVQKHKYIPDLAAGRKLGAFALIEPGAGTSVQGQQTKTVLEEDGWVLNGSKCFIINGGGADVYVVFTITGVTEKKGRKAKEISAFTVDKGTPGFSFGTKEKKMGVRDSSTYKLIFSSCRIPKKNLLGMAGRGFGTAMRTLDGGRIDIAAQALGLAEGAFEAVVKYVKERKRSDHAIGQFQNTQSRLTDMAAKIEAAELPIYKAAMTKQTQRSYGVEAAMARLYAAETAMEVTERAVQFHGGYGYIREYDVKRMMRDAKITEIYEGILEVQRTVISGSVLK